ncbi:MAG: hypothetical protein ACXVOI_04565 [Tumebacillaceae bacterium]
MKIKVWMGMTLASLVVMGGVLFYSGTALKSVAEPDPFDPLGVHQSVAASDPFDPLVQHPVVAAVDPFDPFAVKIG